MATTRLPTRVRAGVAVVAVLAIAAIGGATAVVQYGAAALHVGGGFTSSDVWAPGSQWAGIEVRNTSDVPITLRAVQARGAENVVILRTRVIEPRGAHLLQNGTPLPADVRSDLDRSRPVDGFVLPPHSGSRFEVAVEFRPASSGQAVLSRTTITYSALGLDHGAISDGVYCVRAPGSETCPPFEP